MNARVAFDTHGFVKRLEAAGWSVPEAEALADALGDIVLHSIATRADLRETEVSLRSDLRETEVSLRSDLRETEVSLRSEIKQVEISLRTELKELELRLTLRTGGMLAAAVAILAALKILT